MPYQLYIFDFDGTLADSLGWFLSVINDVADKYRFKRIAHDEREVLRGYSARDVMRHLGVPMWKMPMIAAHLRERMTEDIDQIRLFPGIPALLQRLTDHGAAIAIVSSNTETNVRKVLGPESADRITYYECGTSIFGKSTRLQHVLRRSGVIPTAAIFIGDEVRDADAAATAKIAFGAVSWGYTLPTTLVTHRPAAVFTDPNEIGR